MNIHEYQGKELLAKFGIAIPAVLPPTQWPKRLKRQANCRGRFMW